MNTVQRIAKNMAVLFVARIVSMLFGFFYVMYTARYLGPANYGILAFALALNGIFGVIANFGLDPLTVREVARDKSLARKYLANGIVLKLIFGSLTFLIVFLVVNLLGYPEITRKVVYIITLSTIIAGISNLFNDIYQAFERMEFISIGQVLQSVLSLVFAIAAIRLGLNVVYFAMIYLIVNLTALGYHVVVTTLKFLKPRIEVDLSFWKSVVREAWPFALTAAFVGMYYYSDSVMISYIRGNFEVGIYNAAYRLAMVFSLIPQVYFTSVFPNMARTYRKNKIFEELVIASLGLMSLACFLVGIAGTIFSKFLILVIYGEEYYQSIPIFSLLIWSIAISFINTSLANVLDATGNQHLNSLRMALGIVFNIMLNLILIPKYGAYGAAVATLITRIFIGILLWYLIVEKLKLRVRPTIKDMKRIARIIQIQLRGLLWHTR